MFYKLILLLFPLSNNLVIHGKILAQDLLVLRLVKLDHSFDKKVILFLSMAFIFAILYIVDRNDDYLRWIWGFLMASFFTKPLRKRLDTVVFISSVYSAYAVAASLLMMYGIANISLNFGSLSLLDNTYANAAIYPRSFSSLRMGGLMREPNWLSLVIIPGLFLAKKRRNIFIIVLGLLFSKSSFGLLILILYTIKSVKKKYLLPLSIIALLLMRNLALIFPRLFDIFNRDGSSFYVRVVYPLVDIYSHLSFFPRGAVEFPFKPTYWVMVNSLGFFLTSLFLFLLYRLSNLKILFWIFLMAILSEGFYGRSEFIFWLAIL